jgi:virginiamycin B lyase
MLRRFRAKLAIALVAVAAMVCIHTIRAANHAGSLLGVVKSSAGEPVSGAFVKLKNADKRLTFLVISQAQGRYSANNLPSGRYTVQAVGNGFQSQAASVDVSTGGAAKADLSLTSPQAPMLTPGWPGHPGNLSGGESGGGPPPRLPEGDGKRIVETRCQQCHDAGGIVTHRGDRDDWQLIVQTMRDFAQAVANAKDLTDQEAKVAVDYLAANFPAENKPDLNSRLPRTVLKGDAAKYTVVAFEIPTVGVEPHEITVDTKGNGWVSERTGGRMGKLDPVTLTFTEVAPPPAQSKAFHLGGIERGAGDTLWMVDIGPNRHWLNYDTKTGEFNTYDAPKVKRGSHAGTAMRYKASDGTIWLAGIASNSVFGLNPQTKQFVSYEVPSGVQAKKNSRPYGMAISGDGRIWFAENAMNKMGRLDPVSGKIDEFEVPVADADPRKMGSDRSGNIWVGLHGAGKLMKIDYQTAQMTIYSPPTENAGVYSVQGDPKSDLIWFSEQTVDKIARFDPKTQTFTEFPLPYAESDVRRIEIDPNNSNRIWWSGNSANLMGYLEVSR